MRADGGTRTLDYRITRPDGVLRHHRSTVGVTRVGDADVRFTGIVRDISAETRIARKLAGRAAGPTALDEWQDFEHGARALLSEFAGAMDLCFGGAWLPRGETLTARLIWHAGDASLEALADATYDLRPSPAASTLGASWTSGRSVVSNQPAAGATTGRARALRDASIKAVLAIPAVAGDETLAILEFLSLQSIEPSAGLQGSLDGVGHEVGRFLKRRRGHLVAPVLTPREQQVLQLDEPMPSGRRTSRAGCMSVPAPSNGTSRTPTRSSAWLTARGPSPTPCVRA